MENNTEIFEVIKLYFYCAMHNGKKFQNIEM